MRFILKTGTCLFLIAIPWLLIQCNQKNPGTGSQDQSLLAEPLMEANREAIIQEKKQIDDFVRRRSWKMNETSTGLRFVITKKGIGAPAKQGRIVKLDYSVTLLTGDTLYLAKKDGPLVFEVGKGQVITGLEEAILLLRVGDQAKIIIPSHLAFGLIGDQKKIHHKASLVYDVEFISMY